MNTVIYYPKMSPSQEWLKVAALCWDKIYRSLVPENYQYPEEIANLNDMFGEILSPVYPVHLDTDNVITRKFENWLEINKNSFSKQLGSFLNSKMLDNHIDLLRNYGLLDNHIDLLRNYGLYDSGIADLLINSKRNQISIPVDVISYYLSLCATKVADELNADLFAENISFTEVIHYNERIGRATVNKKLLQIYLPQKFFHLDPKQIAEFRQEFSAQRLKYEKEINSTFDEFYKITSQNNSPKEWKAFDKTIVIIARQRVEDVKRAYKRANLEMITKSFDVSVTTPALLSVLGSALGIGIVAPVGITAAVALFGVKLFNERAKAKAEREKSAWSYVLDAGKLK